MAHVGDGRKRRASVLGFLVKEKIVDEKIESVERITQEWWPMKTLETIDL